MTDLELRQKAFAIGDLIKDTNISDETIIAQIKEIPELLNAKLRTGMNPFMAAVDCKRISLAKAFVIWVLTSSGHVRLVKAMP